MLFHTQIFLYFFSVIFFLNYIIKDLKSRQVTLLVASFYCYSQFSYESLCFLITSLIINFLFIKFLFTKNKRAYLIISLVFNFGSLVFLKYYNSILKILLFPFPQLHFLSFTNFFLPIGFSIYTLQVFSYSVDLFKGEISGEKNIIPFALYLSFFPRLAAGPIERAKNLLPQFNCQQIKFNYKQVRYGFILFLWGIFKKLVISDRLGFYGSEICSEPDSYHGFELFLAGHFLVFQFYCDFSGYCDMGRGLAKMLGIELSLNFKSPFFSKSPIEFWQKWHISLTKWLNDYILYPILGQSLNYLKVIYGLLVISLFASFWHGHSLKYIFAGIFIGLILSLNFSLRSIRKLRPIYSTFFMSIFSTILTFYHFYFIIILIRSRNLQHATSFFVKVITDNHFAFINIQKIINPAEIYLIISTLTIIISYDFIQRKYDLINELCQLNLLLKWPIYISFTVLTICFSYQLPYNKIFLYFRY